MHFSPELLVRDCELQWKSATADGAPPALWTAEELNRQGLEGLSPQQWVGSGNSLKQLSGIWSGCSSHCPCDSHIMLPSPYSVSTVLRLPCLCLGVSFLLGLPLGLKSLALICNLLSFPLFLLALPCGLPLASYITCMVPSPHADL